MTACQSCGSGELEDVLDFGDTPICNDFTPRPDTPQKRYPMKLVHCRYCGLDQLSYVPPASEVFGPSFNYLSSSSKGVVKHYSEMAASLKGRYGLGPSDLVLDVASNDGVLLKPFRDLGMKTLGVEPVEKIAMLATEQGLLTIPQRFEDVRIRAKPSLITAMDVLAHTDTPHEFLERLYELMAESGALFVCQSQYFPASMAKDEWDTIYFEHARYFSVRSLQALLLRHGIQVDDVEYSDFYGGSFLAHCSLDSRSKLIPERLHVDYSAFARRTERNIKKLGSMLVDYKWQHKRVAGIGAPMKSSTLLNAIGADSSLVAYLTEVNPLKVGTYAPGTRIPVVDESVFFAKPPDVALVLTWNYAEPIMAAYRKRGYRGAFVVPIPHPKVVE